jgi:DNA adenine methylase Dam
MIKLFRYSGAKYRFLERILYYERLQNTQQFIEPFIGSGAVFLNVADKYDQYVINDIDKNLIKIWSSVKNFSFNDYRDLIKESNIKFGDIAHNKESYYAFRNWFNKNKLNSGSLDEGIYIMMLYSMCINSMARWGPNGFNQGFGDRHYIASKNDFAFAKQKLQKTSIFNQDAFEIIENYDTRSAFMFLDPPYFERDSSYAATLEDSYNLLLKTINDLKSNWIYTDMDNYQLIGFIREQLRERVMNTSPLSKESDDQRAEILITNIKPLVKQKGFNLLFK